MIALQDKHGYVTNSILDNSDQSADLFRWCCPSFINSSRTPNESALSEEMGQPEKNYRTNTIKGKDFDMNKLFFVGFL